jgi:RNA polymerase sigma factor (sigma-70 family)
VRDDARDIVRSTATWLPSDNGIEVRPGDPSRAAEVEGWLRDYATGRDPHLRERIVLAHLGLADRLAVPARHQLEGPRPRPLKDRTLQLRRAVDELQQAVGRSPTTVELADHLRLPVEEVLEGLDAAMSRNEVSLDQPVGEDDEGCLGDLLAAPEPREEPEDLLALAGLIAELPELERTVVVLRFFQDLDQSAIAARIGCSQMHASRLLRRALARMRAQLLEP